MAKGKGRKPVRAQTTNATTVRKDSSTFATRLAVLRAQKRMTVAELALQAGLVRQLVYKYERGEQQPTWESVQSLADALGVPTDALRSLRDQ